MANHPIDVGVMSERHVTAFALHGVAAASALQKRCRATTIDEQDGLIARCDTLSNALVEVAAEHRAIARPQLIAHIDDLDCRKVGYGGR